MLFRRSYLLRSAYDELVVVGSRWRRMYARTAHTSLTESVASPCITIIPTLHVASIRFYNRVLEYMQQAVHRHRNVTVLLEGVCDNVAAAQAQMEEYAEIARNEALRETLLEKADSNTLYSPPVMREICAELGVNYDVLHSLESSVRLQDCYLKPKMAALCAAHLRNDADLDMKTVKKLLEAEAAELVALGHPPPPSISVAEVGRYPVVREQRERKVAALARELCERWHAEGWEGEVIIPWGYFHSEAIMHFIAAANTSSTAKVKSGDGRIGSGSGANSVRTSIHDDTEAAACSSSPTSSSRSAASSEAECGAIVFVEQDEVVAKETFDIPREIIESSSHGGCTGREQTGATSSTPEDNSHTHE